MLNVLHNVVTDINYAVGKNALHAWPFNMCIIIIIIIIVFRS